MTIVDVMERVRDDYKRYVDFHRTQEGDCEDRRICTEVVEVVDFLLEQHARLEEKNDA
tara:strand:- start:258 stop:431 length:174 start_codon:yes stop_codon:yes gene_type:complete